MLKEENVIKVWTVKCSKTLTKTKVMSIYLQFQRHRYQVRVKSPLYNGTNFIGIYCSGVKLGAENMVQLLELNSKKKLIFKPCIIFKCKNPYHNVQIWIKFETDKLAYVRYVKGEGKSGLSIHTMIVCYASIRQSMANI